MRGLLRAPITGAWLGVVLLTGACSPAPERGTDQESLAEDQKRGRAVFLESCHKCHPGGASGLGPGLNNRWIPKPVLKLQVRRGLGAMPAFSEERLSDSDVDALAQYLTYLRRR